MGTLCDHSCRRGLCVGAFDMRWTACALKRQHLFVQVCLWAVTHVACPPGTSFLFCVLSQSAALILPLVPPKGTAIYLQSITVCHSFCIFLWGISRRYFKSGVWESCENSCTAARTPRGSPHSLGGIPKPVHCAAPETEAMVIVMRTAPLLICSLGLIGTR